jgi:uncharacterized protein YuzE
MNRSTPYTYDSGLDILSLSTEGDYEESAAIAGLLMADFDTQGRCMGFEFLDAAELFLPYLCPNKFPKADPEEDLLIAYCPESDTLLLHNNEPVSYSENVLGHCIAHLNAERNPVGFTLEKASEHLLPLLLKGRAAEKRSSAD